MLKNLRQYSLLFWLALILMTGFSFLLFASYSISKKSLQGEFSEQILSTIGNNLHASIERELLGPGFITAQMATNNYLRDAISASDTDPAAIQKYLKEIQTKNHLNSVFLISDQTRQYYSANADVKTVSETEKSDEWYFKFAQKKQLAETSIESYDGSIENLTMLFTQRILADDGTYLGLAGIRMNLITLPQMVQAIQKQAGIHIYCIDNKGKFILPASFALLSEKNTQHLKVIKSLMPKIVSNTANQAVHIHPADPESLENLAIDARFIPQFAWNFLILQDNHEALALLQEKLWSGALLCSMISFLVLSLVGWNIRAYHLRMSKTAATDSLTALMNRQAFDFVFRSAVLDSQRSRQVMCVILLDIDFLKKLNDTHGRQIGDHVLKEIALIARRSLRESDIICRWGDEEFLILLKNCSLEKATSISETLRSTIAGNDFSRTTDLAKKRLSVTVSMGVAQYNDEEAEENVFERAAIALEQAKKNGRNSVYFSE